MTDKEFLLVKAKQNELSKGIKIQYCDTFLSKSLGLMFRKALLPDEGIILADQKPSRMNAGIHMFFMNFDIAVLWLDPNLVVIDKAIAKKWRPIYLPKKPAQYVVELHCQMYDEYQVGDHLALRSR